MDIVKGLEVNLESGFGSAADADVAIVEDGEEELEANSQDPTGKIKCKKRTTSIVWSYFDKLSLTKEKRLRAKCKEYSSIYLADSRNGTRSKRHHMITCQRKDT